MSDKSDLIIDLTTKPNFASTTPMFVLISDEPTTLAGIQIKIKKKLPYKKKEIAEADSSYVNKLIIKLGNFNSCTLI